MFEQFGEAIAIELAGEAVVAGEKREPPLVLVPLVDDAKHAVGAQGPSIRSGEPAPGILDPQPGFGAGIRPQRILDLVGDTVPFVVFV